MADYKSRIDDLKLKRDTLVARNTEIQDELQKLQVEGQKNNDDILKIGGTIEALEIISKE